MLYPRARPGVGWEDRRSREPHKATGAPGSGPDAKPTPLDHAIALNQAREQGPDAYAALLARLEELSAAKVAALQAPGQVLLKLAATGFGVRLTG